MKEFADKAYKLKNSEMKQKENSMLTHLEQFAGTSRHNPAILDASLVGEGLGELAARGLLIVRTDWTPWDSRRQATERPADWNGSSAG